MGIQGLTLYHLKSHLQKYRLSKNLHGQANSGSNKAAAGDRISGVNVSQMSNQNTATQTTKNMHLGEAIQMHIEVQRRLHEQLEVQRHLQLRIEAQGKYLQSVLEKAEETLGGQNLGTIGLEAAKIQLSDLVSKVSTQCLNSTFSEMKQLSDLCLQQKQAIQLPYSLSDSRLNSCEGSELYNNIMGLNFRAQMDDDNQIRQQKQSNLSMSIGLEGCQWNSGQDYGEERLKGKFFDENNVVSDDFAKMEKEKTTSEMKLPFFTTKLDLNAEEDKDSCKQLDLNGFSWS
ncbi:hypothetical protein CDL12_01559 [Handroanthus impetiginosus]|nr:hypothetical protein CDL12_01559 [Handroanthus impetiginosus]